jgi:hypothetical protein
MHDVRQWQCVLHLDNTHGQLPTHDNKGPILQNFGTVVMRGVVVYAAPASQWAAETEWEIAGDGNTRSRLEQFPQPCEVLHGAGVQHIIRDTFV